MIEPINIEEFFYLYEQIQNTMKIDHNNELMRNILRACKYHPNKIFLQLCKNYPPITIFPNYKHIYEQILKLKQQPQNEQGSEEWFNDRHNKITASSAASVLDENHYKGSMMEDFLREKVSEKPIFETTKATHHGKKYEPVAIEIYGELYDCMIDEYGLINHEKYSFLGASPDGIVNEYRRSTYGFNNNIGTMIEIKCPYSRKIKKEGEIKGVQCPINYWIQVQLQLECCDLFKCDFCQYNISELETYDDYVNCRKKYTIDELNATSFIKNKFINKEFCLYGIILQFLPKNSDDVFKSKYIYPPYLEQSLEEQNEWILSTLSHLEIDNKELYDNYKFDRVIYYQLKDIHITTIFRDSEWFNNNLPKFEQFWNYVEICRKDPSQLPIIINQIKQNRCDKELIEILSF